MTTAKARAGYLFAGALLTVLILYPTLKETSREQRFGLLMSPEEVKTACGTPQTDDLYRLTYVEGDKRVDLQFMSVNHRTFLNHVKWNSSKGFPVGDINQVSMATITESVKDGSLPACVEAAAR